MQPDLNLLHAVTAASTGANCHDLCTLAQAYVAACTYPDAIFSDVTGLEAELRRELLRIRTSAGGTDASATRRGCQRRARATRTVGRTESKTRRSSEGECDRGASARRGPGAPFRRVE